MKKLVKWGSVLALVSLTVLPLGGCAGETFNGFQILNSSQVPSGIKIFLVLSVISSAVVFFLKEEKFSLVAGVVSALALILAYLSGGELVRAISMKVGFYLAFVGFGLIIVGSLPQRLQEKLLSSFKEKD